MVPPRARRLIAPACALVALALPLTTARGAGPVAGECAPPRTRIALLSLADHTDRAWAAWAGESPARLVARLLADSLEQGRARLVLRPAVVPTGDATDAPPRATDDEPALRAARSLNAEVVVTGTVSVFTREDRREPSRLARWGVGSADARSHVQVSVTLRALDVSDGSVLIETTAARERTGRGTANVMRPDPDAVRTVPDPLLAAVLGEVLGDLTRTLGQRLDARWQARVLSEGRGVYVLDAGASRGLFAGERLDVWRSGMQAFDEDLVRIGDDVRVGAIVVTALAGRARARARLVEGEARGGDHVRPCAAEPAPALSMRR